MDEDSLPPIDYFAPEIVEARDAVARAVSAYMRAIRPAEEPFVIAWAVGIEWTNAELEQAARAGRDVISPNEQAISATAGLGAYLSSRFA